MTTSVQEEKQIDRLWLVKKSYGIAFLVSVAIVLTGWLTAFFINRFCSFGDITTSLLQMFSLVPGAMTLGVRGWDIQTWSGRTPAEILNQNLFLYLSLIGLFLPVVTFSLRPAMTNELPPGVEERILQSLKNEILRELTVQNSIPSTQESIQKSQ